MQIFVCRRKPLLPVTTIKATKPKLSAKAGTTKMLQHAARIMKITAILLLGACLNIHAAGFGQKVTLSEKDTPIERVFEKIQEQTNYKFLYSDQLLKHNPKITISVRNASIEEVLDYCLKGKMLEYEINDKTIIIRSRKDLANNLQFQVVEKRTIDIKGRVVNENGDPVEGVNVIIKGTNNGTTTNSNGEFALRSADENSTLVFTIVNMEPTELKVKGRTFLDVALQTKITAMQEVVINKGYYSEAKRFSTGNVAQITSKEIEKQPVQNPLLALQGRVPGIEITQSTGLTGGNVTVRIQGRNSINSGLDPLIIVDGVPYPSQLPNPIDQSITQGGSPVNYINPEDIESIDILKDADATAIYGSRGGNGVILITTKKGRSGKTKLDINFQQGWGKVEHNVDMMNTQQYLQARWEAFKNSNQLPSANPSASSPFVYAPDLLFWDTTRYTDWQKTLIGGTSQFTKVNASLSGGNSIIQYFVGATYNKQTTVFPGSFDDKVGACHFNINGTSPNQRLRLQLSGSYSYDQNHLPTVDLTNQALLLEPDAPPLFDANGALNWAQNDNGRSTWTNPLAYTVSTDFFTKTKNLISSAFLSYKVFADLTLRCNFGYTDLQMNVNRPQRLEQYKPESRATSQRSSDFANRNMTSWIIEPQLQYTKKIVKGKLEALLGTTIQKSNYDYLFVRGSGFSNDLLMKTLTAASSITVISNNSGITRFNALFGRVGYNWNDKYIINLTGRRDGSNKFGDANKFHNFWSLGAGWIFSNEPWVQQNLPILSFGKLRTSYGTTGNDQIPEFSYLSIYSISNPTILYQNNVGLNASNIYNPYLQWEETRKWQAGVDIGFIKDRAIFGITYTRNSSSNQLIKYSLPNLTGFDSYYENLPALIRNNSWELSITTINIKLKNFAWTSSINLTIPRNQLVSFPGIENTTYASGGSGVKVGQPIGVVQVSSYGGVNPINGAYLMLDKNNNANTSLGGLNMYISPFPQYYGGVLNTLSFKGFQLDFLFQFVRKKGPRDMFFYNGTQYPGEFFAASSNQPVTIVDHWQNPGDIKNVSLYLSSGGSFTLTPLRTSDAWYSYDASYMRLKNLSLSWQIPNGLLKKAHVQSAKIYINGQNLATFTKYSGLDPETMSINTLPPLKMLTVGAKIGF
jgi:TonB-linked SusC/RagA family outer membrane protein